MRTVPFKSVLWSIAKKAGLTPATEGLDRPVAAQITEAINSAVKLAWEYYDWPELCRISTQTVTRDSAHTYVPWLDGDGYHFIGALLNVWTGDPRSSGYPRPCDIPYVLDGDAFFLPASAPEVVYLRYRLPHSVFTDEEYVTGTTYQPQDLVYWADTGECYRCLASGPPVADGVELITNASFTSDLSGWTNSGGLWSWSAGSAAFSALPADAVEAEAGLAQTFTGLVPGRTYRVVFIFGRPPGAAGTWIGAELLTNPDFGVNLDGWTPAGDGVWSHDGIGGLAKWVGATVSDATADFTQTFPNLLPGDYQLDVNLSAIGAENGSMEMDILTNGTPRLNFTGDAIVDTTFYHPGGELVLNARVTVSDNMAGFATAEISSISLKRIYDDAGSIGTLRLSLVQNAVELHYSDPMEAGAEYTFDFVATHSTAFIQAQIFPAYVEGGPLPATGVVNSLSCQAVPSGTPPPWNAGGEFNIDYWALVPFPKILAEAVKAGGLTAWRLTEGQDGSAARMESTMIQWLDYEVDQIHQQQQPVRPCHC